MVKHFLPVEWRADAGIPHIKISRRAFLTANIWATSKLVLNSIDTNRSVARKVMGLGRGRLPVLSSDGHVSYVPTPETIRRAEEMRRYYLAHAAGREITLLVSGGIVERPQEGASEAAFMRDYLLQHGIPIAAIAVEEKSDNTFDNFIKSIEAGDLVAGEFDPDNPLAISASRCHSWRAVPIAQQALALPPKGASLLRLRDGDLENGFVTHTREHVGYALTCLALAEVDAQPGNLEHTREASQLFNDLAQNGVTALGKLACSPRALASLMTVPDIPLAVY